MVPHCLAKPCYVRWGRDGRAIAGDSHIFMCTHPLTHALISCVTFKAVFFDGDQKFLVVFYSTAGGHRSARGPWRLLKACHHCITLHRPVGVEISQITAFYRDAGRVSMSEKKQRGNVLLRFMAVNTTHKLPIHIQG